MKDKIIEKYASFVAERPFTVLVGVLALLVILAVGAVNVETVEQNEEDLLPDTIDSIAAFDVISAEFGQGGGGSSYTILVETDPSHANSTEIRDVREPEMLTYLETVSNDIESMDEVVTVSSAASLVQNPSTTREAERQLRESGQASQYISQDYSFTILTVSTIDLSSDEQEELAERIRTSMRTNDRPSGIDVSYTGNPFINQAFEQQTEDTMSQTSTISLVGVFVVVVFLFGSVVYGLSSLLALIFGIIAGFGLYGWLGFNMSPATSGAVSMGMGIAIDFGIQTVSRFREERKHMKVKDALAETVEGVINPMTIALLAALIGFASLSLGRITFLSDMGTLLTLTTLGAYIGALTLIPASLVIYDRYKDKIILKVKQ